jgi:prophage endopeptidase
MSLFNPYVLLGIVLSILSAFGGGYYKGGQDEVTRQQLEIAKLNAEARQKEQALTAAVNAQATQLMKANQNAKLQAQKRDADIESGMLKLRVAVKASDCSVPASSDSTASSGANLGTASADLDATTSRLIVSLTDEGDTAIRKLNTCINLYNEAYQTLRSKP